VADPDPSLLWTYRPTEPLWTLCKDVGRIDAELLGHGECGWEFRLRGGDEFYAHRFDTKVLAVAHGEFIRREYLRDDWKEGPNGPAAAGRASHLLRRPISSRHCNTRR
jgi:hypothetical protein